MKTAHELMILWAKNYTGSFHQNQCPKLTIGIDQLDNILSEIERLVIFNSQTIFEFHYEFSEELCDKMNELGFLFRFPKGRSKSFFVSLPQPYNPRKNNDTI